MRTRLIALAATLSIAGLAATSIASATVPSGGSGDGVSTGGGGGGHGGGGGGGGYGGHAGYAAHANFLAHGGYVAHGSRGYRFVGHESAGLARAGAVPRVGHAPRISLALGPRIGSAATATRVDHLSRAEHMRPHPGHPGRPGHPHRHPKHFVARNNGAYAYEYVSRPPLFCDFPAFPVANGKQPYASYPCLQPVKAKPASVR